MNTKLPKEAFEKNAEIYKILANHKRLEILNLLRDVKEMSVEEMLKITKLPKANLSQHLALLRHTGLVQTRKSGLHVFYKIIDPRVVDPCKILHNLRLKDIVR